MLVYHPPVEGVLANRQGNEREGEDANRAKALAEAVVLDVRARMPHGPLNNEMRDKGQTKYMCDHPRHLNAMVDTIYYTLGRLEAESDPPPFAYRMAAYARAAREIGGGVCSMLAHVAMGCLTLRGEAGLQAALVVDKNFDHSYCVVASGRSTWFLCDPWVGSPYVIPWEHGFFPREDVSIYYLVDFYGKVEVPYGIEFDDDEVKRVVKTARAARAPGLREMDHHYVHETNVESERRHLYDAPILSPFEWGDGVGRSGRGGKFDLFG